MPELPEVETIRRGLENLAGKKIKQVFRSDKKMRIASTLDLQGLKGAKILEVTRRARYLIVHFSDTKILKQVQDDEGGRQILKQVQDDGLALDEDCDATHKLGHPELVSGSVSSRKSLIIHLGMSGRVTLSKDFQQLKHDHFACEFMDGLWLIFNDPRRFGFIDFLETSSS